MKSRYDTQEARRLHWQQITPAERLIEAMTTYNIAQQQGWDDGEFLNLVMAFIAESPAGNLTGELNNWLGAMATESYDAAEAATEEAIATEIYGIK